MAPNSMNTDDDDDVDADAEFVGFTLAEKFRPT
jgi:hypothetical protein